MSRAAGGGGWPLSGGWKGLEARGGAKRAREGALEAARPPTPAISETRCSMGAGSSRASEWPGESATAWRWGHAPLSCQGSLLLGLHIAAVGLLDGLAADPQGGTDLGPRRTVATGCSSEQISGICQRVLGVSNRLKCLQGPLRATQDRRQRLDSATNPPARISALFGAHVNAYCRRSPTGNQRHPTTLIAGSICDTTFSWHPSRRVASSISDHSGIRYRLTTEKKRPRAAPTAGVVDDIRGN